MSSQIEILLGELVEELKETNRILRNEFEHEEILEERKKWK